MGTFYDEWLNARNLIQDELLASVFVARDKDIPWVSTPALGFALAGRGSERSAEFGRN